MGHPHLALIVEDEPEVAADLKEILTSCGCESVIVTNRRDALAHVGRTAFCIVLLDLQIKSEPDSIRGLLDHGKLLLTEIRGRYPELVGSKHALPIVVFSGFAAEAEAAVAVMRDGASDVVQKLSSQSHKMDRIQGALEASGRTSHRVCDERWGRHSPEDPRRGLVLSIPGDQVGRRVVVRLGQRPAKLTHSALKVLLHLVKAHLSKTPVHKNDLGAQSDRGFRSVSVLRSELAPACDGDEKSLISNDQRGYYCLADRVTVGPVDAEKLERVGDHQITKLAREILRLFPPIEESAGKG